MKNFSCFLYVWICLKSQAFKMASNNPRQIGRDPLFFEAKIPYPVILKMREPKENQGRFFIWLAALKNFS